MDFLGNILLFAGKIPPQDYVFCDGRFLSKTIFDALFHLIGYTYGGDGEDKFAVPNLNLRVPIGTGKGNSSSTEYAYASSGGKDQYWIQQGNIPNHEHEMSGRIRVHNQQANSNTPESNYFSYTANDKDYGDTADGTMSENLIEIGLYPDSVSPVEQKPINNMQPYIAINYIICVYGRYPSKN
jgi:microcystin-dependent protein